MTVRNFDSMTGPTMETTAPGRMPRRLLTAGLVMGAVVVTASACGGSTPASTAAPTAAPKTVNITLVGKIDADKGPAGTFTGKEHWPALAPSDIKANKGDTVVLTIKEYDDAPTALSAGSPYNAVTGGTETINGTAATSVSNANIAHTFTVPELGINAPLAKAKTDGVTTMVYTFKADKAGTFAWRCLTPCGAGTDGMGGAMATKSWMMGNVIIT